MNSEADFVFYRYQLARTSKRHRLQGERGSDEDLPCPQLDAVFIDGIQKKYHSIVKEAISSVFSA